MCGIAGIVDNKRGSELNHKELLDMLGAIKHRGPDASGVYNFEKFYIGHNRLSIIDLNSRSDQPFKFGSLVITYNGEVYNYIEIRKELENKGHVFKTASDTEVILHAYFEWGSDCVKRFVGMWAFAILDTEKGEMFFSRDRFGIKPLYYLFKDQSLIFSSEIKALKKTAYFQSDLNVAQVARYLQLGWIGYYDETFFEHVSSLPAGHNMIYKNGKVEVFRYYDIEIDSNRSNYTYEDNVQHFKELFLNSIDLHLRSDEEIATCLSGGIDSSAIVGSVCNLRPEIKYDSFSIYYTGEGTVDERPFIREVIKKYPNVNPNYYQPSYDEVASNFEKALYFQDVPPSSSSFISQYFLMKLISEKGIKVVLDGQGSDEYLAGYMHSFYRLIGGHFRKFNFRQGYNELKLSNANRGGSSKIMSEFLKSMLSVLFDEQELYGLEYRYYHPKMTKYKGAVPFNLKKASSDKLDNFLYHLCFNTSLPNLLHYEDSNSMAFSVESRVPFLDHRLVEFTFSLDNESKIFNGVTKRILRDAMKGIIPDSVYHRKDKKGFVTPGLEKWGDLFEGLKRDENVEDSKLTSFDFLIRNAVEGFRYKTFIKCFQN